VEYYIELANFTARAGFDFYPNYGRYVIQSLLQGIEENEGYYRLKAMDPNYNSDPTRFEVKEVSVNIALESV
jgi:hypothetical protein